MTTETHIEVPTDGERIVAGRPTPDNPIIPFIEGDGIGIDITPVMKAVVDAAVEKAYGGTRRIRWLEIYAGEKATRIYGSDVWLPDETLTAAREYAVSIKGPMTTPIGGGPLAQRRPAAGARSLRLPSPGPLLRGRSEPAPRSVEDGHGDLPREHGGHLRRDRMAGRDGRQPEGDRVPPGRDGRAQDPLPGDLQHRDQAGLARGLRAARAPGDPYALDHDRRSVTLVHKGNIMKFTEGSFRDWGYALAAREFGAEPLDGGPWLASSTRDDVTVKDVIADAFLQQILLRPAEYDVIATLNLNGDYISDALAAQVGGIGIAPGANLSDEVAMFEATHGTAPKYAGQDKVNPGSIILSAEMMLRHIDWPEAADLIISSLGATIADKQVTYDLARLRRGARGLVLRLRPGDDRTHVTPLPGPCPAGNGGTQPRPRGPPISSRRRNTARANVMIQLETSS